MMLFNWNKFGLFRKCDFSLAVRSNQIIAFVFGKVGRSEHAAVGRQQLNVSRKSKWQSQIYGMLVARSRMFYIFLQCFIKKIPVSLTSQRWNIFSNDRTKKSPEKSSEHFQLFVSSINFPSMNIFLCFPFSSVTPLGATKSRFGWVDIETRRRAWGGDEISPFDLFSFPLLPTDSTSTSRDALD